MRSDLLRETLRWITDILHERSIPFQIAGGLAAHAYGARRLINDIDIDIPDERMEDLVPAVARYITCGPERYRDERWDLLLMTLDYHGQLIDVGGAATVRICDARTSAWVAVPWDLSSVRYMELFGITVPVIPPERLLSYKQMLVGVHQHEDIAAVRAYLCKAA